MAVSQFMKFKCEEGSNKYYLKLGQKQISSYQIGPNGMVVEKFSGSSKES